MIRIDDFRARYVSGAVEVGFAAYGNGRTAIRLTDAETGEQQCICTVNIEDEPLAEGDVFLKGWSENEGIPAELVRHGIVAPPHDSVVTGYVVATKHRLTASAEPLPVVDGDAGQVDEYGMASTRTEAMAVAAQGFADPVIDAYISTNITLSDGRVLPKAWVAVTHDIPATDAEGN